MTAPYKHEPTERYRRFVFVLLLVTYGPLIILVLTRCGQ